MLASNCDWLMLSGHLPALFVCVAGQVDYRYAPRAMDLRRAAGMVFRT